MGLEPLECYHILECGSTLNVSGSPFVTALAICQDPGGQSQEPVQTTPAGIGRNMVLRMGGIKQPCLL